MATAGTLNKAVIAAMEELELEGWIPGYRPRTRTVRRDTGATPGVGSNRAHELAIKPRASGELVGLTALGATVAGTLVWAFQRDEDAGVLAEVAAAPAGSTWKRAAAMVGGIVCGLGMAAASVLVLLGRRGR